ncbi:hypothetical protein V8C86DRAFT_3035450, partial [Haematococcus lacustris]
MYRRASRWEATESRCPVAPRSGGPRAHRLRQLRLTQHSPHHCSLPSAPARAGSVRCRAALPPAPLPATSGLGQPGEPRTEWTDAALLHTPLAQLMSAAAALRDQAHPHITFSPKVFLPLTRLCRDTCGYCAFTQDPVPGRRSFMTLEEVIKVAREGAAQGCCEALLTLGDRPEARWAEAGEELHAMGYASTLDYVEAAAAAVLHRTGLLPHINAGLMSASWLARLKAVSASQGLMLESGAPELLLPGGAHHGCPDKEPEARREVIRAAGRARVPFTTGLLVGLGESRAQRLADLRFLADCQQRWGHLQEVIIQNFRAKQGTAMAAWPEPPLEEVLWTVAAARLVLGPLVSLQAGGRGEPQGPGGQPLAGGSQQQGQGGRVWALCAPPNLTPEADDSQQGGAGARAAGWTALLRAGINDWGGISPLTRDWVNPEAPWPHLEALAQATAAAGFLLLPRLPVYPAYQGWRGAQPLGRTHTPSPGPEGGRPRPDCQAPPPCPPCPPPPALASAASHAPEAPAAPLSAWLSAEGGPGSVAAQVRRLADGSGLVRGSSWFAALPPSRPAPGSRGLPPPRWHVAMSEDGCLLGFPQPPGVSRRIALLLERVMLLATRHARQVMSEEQQQQQAAGGTEGGGPGGEGPWQARALPPAWVNPLGQADVAALLAARGPDCRAVLRAADQLRQMVCILKCGFCAFSKGKVCMQGGIHPEFSGGTYLQLLEAAKAGAPDIHVHAFSPLEVHQCVHGVQGAATLGLDLPDYLAQLRAAGLGSLPGTAAEVLCDDVRAALCPDKISTQRWLEVVEAAHRVGLRSTATLMFGHLEAGPWAAAAHLMRLRELQPLPALPPLARWLPHPLPA